MENRTIKLLSRPFDNTRAARTVMVPLFDIDNSDATNFIINHTDVESLTKESVTCMVGDYDRRSLNLVSEHSHLRIDPAHFQSPEVLTWNRFGEDKWATETQILEFPYRVISCRKGIWDALGRIELSDKLVDVVEKYFFLTNGLVGAGYWGPVHYSLSCLVNLYNEHYLADVTGKGIDIDNLVWWPEDVDSGTTISIVIHPDSDTMYALKKDRALAPTPALQTRFRFKLPTPYKVVCHHRGNWNDVDYYQYDIEIVKEDESLPF